MMWQVSGNTSGQIAKSSLVISTMKAKGLKCFLQAECSWFMTTKILTNGIMLIPKVIQLVMHQGVWMWQIQRRSRDGIMVQFLMASWTILVFRKGWLFKFGWIWLRYQTGSESKCHKDFLEFCISLVRRKDNRLDKKEKDHWDCSKICTSTEAKAVTTLRCINSYAQSCGGHWVVGKGKHQNHQDAPTKRTY